MGAAGLPRRGGWARDEYRVFCGGKRTVDGVIDTDELRGGKTCRPSGTRNCSRAPPTPGLANDAPWKGVGSTDGATASFAGGVSTFDGCGRLTVVKAGGDDGVLACGGESPRSDDPRWEVLVHAAPDAVHHRLLG